VPKFFWAEMKKFQLYKISGQHKVAQNSSTASWEKILLNLFEQKWKKLNQYYLPEIYRAV